MHLVYALSCVGGACAVLGVTTCDPPLPSPIQVTVEASPAADGKGGFGEAQPPRMGSPNMLGRAHARYSFLFYQN